MTIPGRFAATQLLLRTLVVLAAVAALGCTRIAGSSVPLLEVVIVALALGCAWAPDTHLGMLVILLIGIHWLVAVDDVTTPWAVGTGLAIAVLHLAAAGASVGPPAAAWTRAMKVRWGRRLGLAAASTVPVWLVVDLADRAAVGRSPLLVTTALLGLAAALLWLSGNLLARDA